MLILERKPGESIVIGAVVRVTVMTVWHGRIRVLLTPLCVYPDAQPQRHTLHIGQTLKLTEAISIIVVSIYGCAIKIGVDAPREIAIDREEIHLRKLAERQRAG